MLDVMDAMTPEAFWNASLSMPCGAGPVLVAYLLSSVLSIEARDGKSNPGADANQEGTSGVGAAASAVETRHAAPNELLEFLLETH
jgi:hypothetical protein